MLALATHNFFSAAAGMAIAIALVRGFARHSSERIGSFWVDLVRATVYVLLPLSIAIALFFVSQGVISEFEPLHQRDNPGGRQADHRARPGS